LADFDAIVVGAGIAGLSSGYVMASAGLNILVVERGKVPGSKNVTGGRIYTHAIEKFTPELMEDLPFEREIVKERISFLTDESATTLEFSGKTEGRSYTVIREKLDGWLAGKVEEKGGIVASGVRVDDLIREEDTTGICAGDDEITARAVIIADGVNSPLGKKAGLRDDFKAEELAVGVKEVIKLGEEEINRRFQVDSKEGVANLMVGSPTDGLPGGGFLYTNLETISLGIVANVKEIASHGSDLDELLSGLKEHPYVRPLINGGTTVEYSAHMIPEGGIRAIPKLVGEGYLLTGDAAGFCLNTGFTVRGMDFAFASGVLAAQTIIKCSEKNDFSLKSLALYEQLLESEFVLKDLRKFEKAPIFLSSSRIYSLYPDLVNVMVKKIFDIKGEQETLCKQIREAIKEADVSTFTLMKDLWKGSRIL
jgi:electron transfer flavoprotein-quinone oxidoreductase